jgi:hypothetical protein
MGFSSLIQIHNNRKGERLKTYSSLPPLPFIEAEILVRKECGFSSLIQIQNNKIGERLKSHLS